MKVKKTQTKITFSNGILALVSTLANVVFAFAFFIILLSAAVGPGSLHTNLEAILLLLISIFYLLYLIVFTQFFKRFVPISSAKLFIIACGPLFLIPLLFVLHWIQQQTIGYLLEILYVLGKIIRAAS
jgi:hypothetical protein